ncbi:MAG: four helix bundle protein [Chloroflexota bacterium]
MRDFRDIKAWHKAHSLVLSVYDATRQFPDDERYGLTSQIRRASASIPANIAEGCGKGSDAELARFMQISMGSASELEYHLLLARDLHYLNNTTYDDLHSRTVEVKKMLAPFIKTLRNRK